jgi:hypothetical protein
MGATFCQARRRLLLRAEENRMNQGGNDDDYKLSLAASKSRLMFLILSVILYTTVLVYL